MDSELLTGLKALAHETRLQMVELLLSQNLCVGALAHNLGISKAATSQHLQILRKAGLVKGEKIGYWTHYAVQENALQLLGERLKNLHKQTNGLKDLNIDIFFNENSNSKQGGE